MRVLARAATALAAIGLSVAVVAGCSTGKDAVETGTGNQIVAPGGNTVIDYSAEQRKPIGTVSGEDLFGKGAINLEQYRGKVVVVNVWASWCAPCRKEFVELQKVYDETKQLGVAFVGINFRDNRESAQDFMTDRNITYQSIFDYGGATLGPLGAPVGAVPTTIVLDRELRPAKVFIKAVGEDELRSAVEQVAAEGAQPNK